MITVARHAIALDHHALLFAPGMMFITNIALTPNTESGIEIMRDQIGGPLGGPHRLATHIAHIALGVSLLNLTAWRVLIERKMLNAVAVTTLRAAPRSYLLANLAGLLHVLLKHQDVPPDSVVWLRRSQRDA